MKTEWMIFEPARTYHLGLKAQNFENAIFTFGYFSLKAVIILANYKGFCKLQSFCLHVPLPLYFSGTYLLKLSFSYTFVTRWSALVVIDFHFLGTGFTNIPPTLLISCGFNKVFKDIKIILSSTFETIYQVAM